MNAMEARTRAALHRVADGLLVSEQDLDRLEGTLMTLLETKPDRGTARVPRNQWSWAIAAVATLALVVGGLALWRTNRETTPPASPPRTDSLVPPEFVGLYLNEGSPWLWEITADGRIGQADAPGKYLGGGAVSDRILDWTDHEFTVADAATKAGCVLRFRITPPAAGQVTVTEVPGLCSDGSGEAFVLEQVAPRDPAAPAPKTAFTREAPRDMDRITQVQGSWVDLENGQVLVVGVPQDGYTGLTYLLDDDGDGSVDPDQRGTLRMADDGSMRGQPEAKYLGACSLVFDKAVTDAATMTTTSGTGGCFPGGSTQTWLRLN